jgi:hypothetical protein
MMVPYLLSYIIIYVDKTETDQFANRQFKAIKNRTFCTEMTLFRDQPNTSSTNLAVGFELQKVM